jgi:ActR/RegA family two-component response regulator
MGRTILLCGHDQVLLRTRHLILEQAGHSVFRAEGALDAVLVLMNHQIDFAILCQTLSEDERKTILENAHGLQPEMKCVVLGAGGNNSEFDGLLSLLWLEGPRTLLKILEMGKSVEENVPSVSN